MQIILPPSFQKSQIPGLPDGITSLPVKYAIWPQLTLVTGRQNSDLISPGLLCSAGLNSFFVLVCH